jgi:hypothetical protein
MAVDARAPTSSAYCDTEETRTANAAVRATPFLRFGPWRETILCQPTRQRARPCIQQIPEARKDALFVSDGGMVSPQPPADPAAEVGSSVIHRYHVYVRDRCDMSKV